MIVEKTFIDSIDNEESGWHLDVGGFVTPEIYFLCCNSMAWSEEKERIVRPGVEE